MAKIPQGVNNLNLMSKSPNGKQAKILNEILRETDIERERDRKQKEREKDTERQKKKILGTLLDIETAIERIQRKERKRERD